MNSIRSSLIRIASTQPKYQAVLLPFLKRDAGTTGTPKVAVSIGDTIEAKGGYRVQRWTSAVKVTDLTNAGKKGKICEEATLYDLDYVYQGNEKGSDLQIMIDGFATQVALWRNFDDVKAAMKIFIEALEEAGAKYLPKFQLQNLRSYSVAPAGFQPFKMETPNVSINADYDSFTVADKIDTNNLPACIPRSNGSKNDVKAFYRWVHDNEILLKRMTYQNVLNGMQAAGIDYHDYCRMD